MRAKDVDLSTKPTHSEINKRKRSTIDDDGNED